MATGASPAVNIGGGQEEIVQDDGGRGGGPAEARGQLGGDQEEQARRQPLQEEEGGSRSLLLQAGMMSLYPSSNRHAVTLESIPGMKRGIWSENPILQWIATTQFKMLLSVGMHIFSDVIESGVVPRIVEFLSKHDLPQLQYEAAGALTAITNGTSEHTEVLIDHGVVPKFVQLLSSPIDEVREQGCRALARIAGDSQVYRDLVLGHGALTPLLAQLNERSKLSVLRAATSTLLSLSPVPLEQMKTALQELKHLIYLTDESVLKCACWSLYFLSDEKYAIQTVIEAGICPKLVELMHHPSSKVHIPAMMTMSNMTTGNDAQAQCIIDNQGLPCLRKALTERYTDTKRYACRIIADITIKNVNQIQAVIDADIISPLLHLLQHGPFHMKVLAAQAVSNAIARGSHKQIQYDSFFPSIYSERCFYLLFRIQDLNSFDPIKMGSTIGSIDKTFLTGRQLQLSKMKR